MYMSTKGIRSKTGCMTCKNRRKKCDETRPVCERCTKAGMTCLGYSYLDNQSKQTARIRSKAAMRVAAVASNVDNLTQAGSSQPYPSAACTINLGTESQCIIPEQHTLESPISRLTRDQAYYPTNVDNFQKFLAGISPNEIVSGDAVYDFSVFSTVQHCSPAPLSSRWDRGLMSREDPNLDSTSNTMSFAVPGPSALRDSSRTLDRRSNLQFPNVPYSNLALSPPLTTGQASLFNALLDPGQPPLGLAPLVPPPSMQDGSAAHGTQGSQLLPSNSEKDNDEVAKNEDSDPEDIKEIVCGTLALDSTVQSNSLPFVLQSYANWMTNMVFEPLRLASRLKNRITGRFVHSEDSRISVTMFAGLLHAMWKKRVVAADYMAIASLLGQRVRGRVTQACSELQLVAKDGDNVNQALYESIEMISILCVTAPSWSPYTLLKDTAPLFLRACPEPLSEPIDLPKKFLHSDVDLRHFIVLDVIMSVSYCQPMLFRYKIGYDPDLTYATFATETKGFQWLSGVPDHIVFLLARMNVLRVDHGPNVDPVIVASLAEELQGFKPNLSVSTDAYLTIARLAVQECWRLAAFVYLYMGLGGANSTDPRVEKVYKSFMRLLERTKPGRTPDAFLIGPMLLAGVASRNERERALIRGRLLGLQECAHTGTCGNDVVLVLNDIWARSGIERRPAVWDDLRIGYANILGCG